MSTAPLRNLPHRNATFIEPMECLSVSKLPEGTQWVWEIKLDGYRSIAVKSSRVTLWSRRRNSLNIKFPYIVEPLNDLPEGTVVDGELVAIDDGGRPSFHALQNFPAAARIHFYIFDLLCCKNRDLTGVPFIDRRALLKSMISIRDDRIRISDYVETNSTELLATVREQNLEGVVGKRKDGVYEAGERSGSWIKHRINLGQELVIGGYTPGPYGFDAIIVGYFRGKDLIYVGKVRNGFVPATRQVIFKLLNPLAMPRCPFGNLPETRRTRRGEGLNAEAMKGCVWLKPKVVAQIEFLEWTTNDHLRHPKFVGLRTDKLAQKVGKDDMN